MITMFNAFLNKPAPSQNVFCFDSLEKKNNECNLFAIFRRFLFSGNPGEHECLSAADRKRKKKRSVHFSFLDVWQIQEGTSSRTERREIFRMILFLHWAFERRNHF